MYCDSCQGCLLEFLALHELLKCLKISLFELSFVRLMLMIFEPGMIENFLGTQSSFRLRNHLFNQIFSLFRNFAPFLFIKGEFTLLHSSENVLVIIASEWRISAKENVKDASCRPDIAWLVVVSRQDLWRDIIRRTSPSLHPLNLSSISIMANFWKTKIDDLDVIGKLVVLRWFGHIEEVFWLEISVSDVVGMAVEDSLHDLFEDKGCIVFIKALLSNNVVE